MSGNKSRTQLRTSRHRRIRRTIHGSAERPRMAVMISNKHMYVQFIDDDRKHTLACASTIRLDNGGPNISNADNLGRVAAKNAKEAGIAFVVVDRGGFRFHGRVKAIIQSAIENGISIGKHDSKGFLLKKTEEKLGDSPQNNIIDGVDEKEI